MSNDPWRPTRAYTDQAHVDALLWEAFRTAGYRQCACGALVEPPDAVCAPCRYGNRAGPLYG